jgi:hypothetical protein
MQENIGVPFIFLHTSSFSFFFPRWMGKLFSISMAHCGNMGGYNLCLWTQVFYLPVFNHYPIVLASSHGTCFCWFFKHSGYVYIMLLGAIGFTSLSLDEELFLFWCYRLFYFGKKFVLVLYQLDIVRIKCTWIIILSFLNTKVYVGKAV